MAQLDFAVTKDEYALLLEELFDKGHKLCIKKHYTDTKPEYVAAKSDIRQLLDAKQYHFYLERPDYSRYPVKTRSFMRKGVQMWAPDPQYCGPLISLGFWAPYERDGFRAIPVSAIDHYASIYHPVTEESEKVGDAVRKAYKEIVDPMRKRFRKVKFTKRTAYVSPGVDEMLQSGWVLGWSVPPAARVGSQAGKMESGTS